MEKSLEAPKKTSLTEVLECAGESNCFSGVRVDHNLSNNPPNFEK